MKKNAKRKAKAKGKKATRKAARAEHLRNSKTGNFMERFREDTSMVEYFSRLTILNPPSSAHRNLNEPRREGGFVRLAHAKDEFTAPILTKGKAATRRQREAEASKVTASDETPTKKRRDTSEKR